MKVGLHPYETCYVKKVHINTIHRKIKEAVAQGKCIATICWTDEEKPLKINDFKSFYFPDICLAALGTGSLTI